MGDPDAPSFFPRIALAAPARGGKATSSSTQQCRLNFLAVMDPLGELVACIHRQATTDGLRTRAQSRAAAPETAAAPP